MKNKARFLFFFVLIPFTALSITYINEPAVDIIRGSHTEDSTLGKYVKSVDANLGQTLSSGNTKTVTSSDAQPSSPWTGEWEVTRAMGTVRVLTTLFSTTSSGLGGTFTFEFSEDCSTATISETRTITSFSAIRDFDLKNVGACYRVKFEPDVALGSNTVIITTQYDNSFNGSFVRLANQQIEKQNAAMPQTFAYMKGFFTDGISKDVAVNKEGAIATSEYLFDASRGQFPGISSDIVFGNNPDVDTTAEDVWNGGGLYTGFPSETETIECFSSDANDTSAGTGARTIRLFGLDASFDEQEVDVTLNGASAVATTETWTRMNKVTVLTAGSGGENAGEITCRHTTTTANVFAVMPAGNNHTAIAAYTIPNNKTGYLVRYRVSLVKSGGSAGSGLYTVRIREPNGVFVGKRREDVSTNYQVTVNARGSIALPEKTDIKIRMESASSNNNSVAAALEIVLVDD